MKIFFLPFFTIFLIFMNPAISEQKVVFVDMNIVISKSKVGASILNQLSDINDKDLIILKKEEKIFKEKEKKLISQKNIISETDFQTKIDELRSEINAYNQNRNIMIRDFKQLKIDSTNKLLILINPILLKYSNDNGISIILQKKNIVIGQNELDITNEIIKIVNNDVQNFKIN
tara:strand:- start:189 stop:710 length:522 start_codon:yes stop_codon:yes gene_type:complete